MTEALQHYAEWLQALPPGWLYAVLFGTAFLENVLPPFPGDVSAVVAGYLVGVGLIGLAPTVGCIAVGSTCGFMTMYAVGWRLGDAVEDPARLRWIPKGPVATARRWLRRWGYALIAVNRFLSGTRAVVTLLAGAARLRPGLTAACAAFSALVWTGLLVYAGYAVGAHWTRIVPWLQAYGRAVTGAVLLVALALAARWVWRRRYGRVRAPGEAGEGRGPRNREDPPG